MAEQPGLLPYFVLQIDINTGILIDFGVKSEIIIRIALDQMHLKNSQRCADQNHLTTTLNSDYLTHV